MKSCWKFFCMRIPQRWVFALMGSLALMNLYGMRICLSLAITAMVASKNTSMNGTESDLTCPLPESTSSSPNGVVTFKWDEHTQGVILSSFFWGYIAAQIPGGVLATKFGGKYTLGLGILSTSIFTLLTPTVGKAYDATGLMVLRIFMGIGEGTTFPAVAALIAQWAPPHERSKITTVVFSGAQVGTILANGLSGVLIHYSSAGWSAAFYVFGALGILWFPAWVVLCYSYPDGHPFISENEKNYLHGTMSEHTQRQVQPIPWRHMLTSVPLWALLAGRFGREWGFQMMVADLPKYMSNVLKFSTKTSGFLTALPNVAMWIVGIGSSCLADWLIKSDKISRTNVRKLFTTISALGPAVCIMAASYAGCDHTVVVILFTVSMGMMGFAYPGVITNTLDLCPNYSGTLMVFLTVIISLCGMMAPYIVGVLTPHQALTEWRMAFWITFAVYCVTIVIFDFWADGEVQYWNNLDSRVDKRNEFVEDKEEIPFLNIATKIDRISSKPAE